MSVNAPKPNEMQLIDYAEHTLECDTRWLVAYREEVEEKERKEAADAGRENEDPRVGADLTDAQVNTLLNLRK